MLHSKTPLRYRHQRVFSQICYPTIFLKVERVHYIMKCERIYVQISAVTVTNLPESTSSCRDHSEAASPSVAVAAFHLMPAGDSTKLYEWNRICECCLHSLFDGNSFKRARV